VFNENGRIMNINFEKVWEKVVMTCLKILSGYLPGGTLENKENLFWLRFELRASPV
jgi:hypothetical protein